MKRLAALGLILLACAAAGCKVHAPVGHPHGAPPGQVKKAFYRCGTCGVTRDVGGSCHGKVMILVP
jgi:hypothetical protein